MEISRIWTTVVVFVLLGFSTALTRPPPTPFLTIDPIEGYCFNTTSYPGIRLTNLADCRSAMMELILQPHFKARFSFSKNPRYGIKVPKQWKHGECTIYVSVGNNFGRDTFSYADIARSAQGVIKDCVSETAASYGGVEAVGTKDFYVAVSRPPDVQGGMGNVTLGSVVRDA